MLYLGGMAVNLAIAFFAYSVLGWMMDTAYRSLEAGRFTRGGFSKAPFSPIYGFGALLAIALAPLLRAWPFWAEGLAYATVLSAYEYASGILTTRVFRRRLWDYTGEFMNFGGHTSVRTALAWGLLGLLLVHVLHPALLRLLD